MLSSGCSFDGNTAAVVAYGKRTVFMTLHVDCRRNRLTASSAALSMTFCGYVGRAVGGGVTYWVCSLTCFFKLLRTVHAADSLYWLFLAIRNDLTSWENDRFQTA